MLGSAVYELHRRWAWVVIVGNAAVGMWALAAHRYSVLRHRALWWFTAVAEVSIFVQVALGIAVVRGGRPIQSLHAFYGFLAIISVAILYSYRLQLKGRTLLLYGGGGLFIMGLCIRALLLRR